ncbi:MAG: hypothetical protein NTU76_03650 [Candidatus Taylorbacteria bacterium]|nr:hypothetical protein [Candidatus Taylorbacteria bacterium]
MSNTSNFSFVTDPIIKENLDTTFDHLLELLSLSESPVYPLNLRSGFRKTIIIYTASIIEALLFWMLRERKTEEEIAEDEIEFKIIKIIYEINDDERIVLGKDCKKKNRYKFEKLNLNQINDLCQKNNLISKDIFNKVDKVRILRNRLHISTLKTVENEYSKTDLEFVFSVAREVKDVVGSNIN